jgi:rsbT antagonist protein RsbS
MGTPTIISGLSPEIAMTLQTMGVELEAVQTALSLEQALAMLGLDVRRAEVEDEQQAERDLWDDEEEDDRLRGRDDARGGRPASGDGPAVGKRKLRFADT